MKFLYSDYMATSTVTDRHKTIEKTPPDVPERTPMNVCPPSSFPEKFQDFFAALTEDGDDLPNMLEEKLIPRLLQNSNTRNAILIYKFQLNNNSSCNKIYVT